MLRKKIVRRTNLQSIQEYNFIIHLSSVRYNCITWNIFLHRNWEWEFLQNEAELFHVNLWQAMNKYNLLSKDLRVLPQEHKLPLTCCMESSWKWLLLGTSSSLLISVNPSHRKPKRKPKRWQKWNSACSTHNCLR